MALEINHIIDGNIYCKLDKIEWNSFRAVQTIEGDDNRNLVFLTFAVYKTRDERLQDPATTKYLSITISIPASSVFDTNFLEQAYTQVKLNQQFSSSLDV